MTRPASPRTPFILLQKLRQAIRRGPAPEPARRRPKPPGFHNWRNYATLLSTAYSRLDIAGWEAGFIKFCIANHDNSRSQLFQDLLVQYLLNEKRHGFFVEFGATDGIQLSNSYLLEKHYGWDGILAEPAHAWHDELEKNRSCRIDKRCVWSTSGEQLEFLEADGKDLSTVSDFAERDMHAQKRQSGTKYTVETVALDDLLEQHRAPKVIDYLSVDTEGSEFRILESFDFSSRRIRVVSVEHNFISPDRELIFELLTGRGFHRILEEYSLFDDWYVEAELAQRAGLS